MKRGTPFRAASSAALGSGSPSVVWPSVRSTIAEGGAPRSSVRTWRVPSPSRDLAAGRLDRAQLLDRLGDFLGTVHLGQQPGRVRGEVEPDLVLLLQLPDEAGLVLEDQPLGDVDARGLRPGGAGRHELAACREPGREAWLASASSFALVSGCSYWSAICSLAESSIMIVK